MIELFNKKYKAISNLFVHTLENDHFVYPAPISMCGKIEDEQNNLKNRIEFKFTNYQDSILILDINFSIFFYLLSYEYRIDCVFIDGLVKDTVHPDSDGYRGIYKFINENVSMNLGETEVFDDYIRLKNTILEIETINER